MTGFGIDPIPTLTRDIFNEVMREFRKMWRDEEYSYDGPSTSASPATDPDAQRPPQAVAEPHPPLWVAAGNPATFEKAAGLGLGVLAFTTRAIPDMKPLVDVYKERIQSAEPVGAYVNDNIMITTGMVCLEDGKKAREAVTKMGIVYLQSLVYYYHDTIPPPEGATRWPDSAPEPDLEQVEWMIDNGYLICGSPDECAEQIAALDTTGIDQLVFGMPIDLPWDQAVETVELFGDRVIPQFDPDPVPKSARARDAAAAAVSA